MTHPGSPASRAWWHDAVCYEIYIRSFADGDGDGVGDLAGIRYGLPYLRDLGVDAIWITPFYPSPMADGGYDVADYRDVEPRFGSLAEFDALVADAHRLGLRVIIDIVPNHTSTAHRWFQEALAARPGSPERSRYIFRPGKGADGSLPPNDWRSVFGGPAWQRVTEYTAAGHRPGEWYLHLFAPEQPDLNWRNPEVREEFCSVLRFWLDRGVDGFRVDVADALIKRTGLPDIGDAEYNDPTQHEHLPYWDEDEVHEIYRDWRKILDSYGGDRMAVGESWVYAPERLARYVRPDELSQAFNFYYLLAPWSAPELRSAVDRSIAATHRVGAPATWVLSNHDVQRHLTRFAGGDAVGHIGTGERRARAATLLMLALPGAVYLYQGEELGLPEVMDLPDEVLQDPIWKRSGHTERGRDGCRVPLPWSGLAPPFGFGPDGAAADPWLPQPPGWRTLTVEAQQRDPGSMLAMYRTALRLRRDHPALGNGEMRWLPSPEHVLAFARDPGFVCTVNLGPEPVGLPEYGDLLLASGPTTASAKGIVLPADTTAWWRTA
jgi:alpha-glucosidase